MTVTHHPETFSVPCAPFLLSPQADILILHVKSFRTVLSASPFVFSVTGLVAKQPNPILQNKSLVCPMPFRQLANF